jgi:hypothetical protein
LNATGDDAKKADREEDECIEDKSSNSLSIKSTVSFSGLGDQSGSLQNYSNPTICSGRAIPWRQADAETQIFHFKMNAKQKTILAK